MCPPFPPRPLFIEDGHSFSTTIADINSPYKTKHNDEPPSQPTSDAARIPTTRSTTPWPQTTSTQPGTPNRYAVHFCTTKNDQFMNIVYYTANSTSSVCKVKVRLHTQRNVAHICLHISAHREKLRFSALREEKCMTFLCEQISASIYARLFSMCVDAYLELLL